MEFSARQSGHFAFGQWPDDERLLGRRCRRPRGCKQEDPGGEAIRKSPHWNLLL
jgi:hypothetical protein